MSLIFTVSMVVYSILLLELIYFMVSTLYYISNNQQYCVFWAAFCKSPPEHLRADSDIHNKSQASVDHIYDPEKISNKKKSFIFYGLETISHSIVLLLFLICCIFYISIIIFLTYLTEYDLWTKYMSFCQNLVRYRLFLLVMPNYLFLIFLLLAVIKTEYVRLSLLPNNNDKFIYLPIITIIWCVICGLIESISRIFLKYKVILFYDDTAAVCYPIGGFGHNKILTIYNNIQFGVCIAFTIISCLIPLYLQQRMLKKLPNSSNNEDIKCLTKDIQNFQKRIAIPSTLYLMIIIFLLYRNSLFLISDYNIGVGLFLGHLIIWVHLYFVMIFIYKDWKQRLFPFGSRTMINIKSSHEIQLDSMPSSSDIPSSKPHLYKEVTVQEIGSHTFS